MFSLIEIVCQISNCIFLPQLVNILTYDFGVGTTKGRVGVECPLYSIFIGNAGCMTLGKRLWQFVQRCQLGRAQRRCSSPNFWPKNQCYRSHLSQAVPTCTACGGSGWWVDFPRQSSIFRDTPDRLVRFFITLLAFLSRRATQPLSRPVSYRLSEGRP